MQALRSAGHKSQSGQSLPWRVHSWKLRGISVSERLVVVAPYEQWLLDLLEVYLTDSGFNVLATQGLGQQANVAHLVLTKPSSWQKPLGFLRPTDLS